ncbi:MAG: hypothetical protein WKG00_29100 [Polyangiaceae bacterium]
MVSEETVDEAARARRLQRLHWLAMAVGSALTVWSVFCVPYIPTNDGPQAVFSVHAAAHHNDAGQPFAEQFGLAVPWANLGFALLYGPLYSAFGWELGLRIAIAVMALTMAWGFAWLVAALAPERRWLGLLGFTLAMSWPLYMGFFSFAISSALGLAAVALLVREPEPPVSRRLVVAVVTLLTLGLHAVAGMIACLAVMGISVLRAPRPRWLREVLWSAAIALPMVAFAVVLNGSRDTLDKAPLSENTMWEGWPMAAFVLPRLMIPGPYWRAGIFFALAAAGPVWSAIEWRRRSRTELAMAAVGGVLFLSGCLMPLHMKGWQYFGARFFLLGAPLCIALLPLERLRRPVALAPAACTALAIGSAWLSASMHRRIYDGCSDFFAGLRAPLHRTGMRLPVTFDYACGVADARWDREVPYLEAPVHLGALYAVAQGGSSPWAFQGTSGIHLLRPRHDPVPRPPFILFTVSADTALRTEARLRRATLTEIASWGMVHQDLIVLGSRPEDAALLTMRGYRIDWQNDSALIAAFEPCPLTVEIGGDATRPAKLQWGVWGLRDVADMPLPAGEAGTPRGVRVPAMCGDLFVRVSWPDDAQARCQEAREDGKVKVTNTREGVTVVCTSP